MRRTIVIGVLSALGFVAVPTSVPAAVAAAAPGIECRVVTGAATVTPGLAAAPAAQTLELDSFHLSHCDGGTTTSANIVGSLHADAAACPSGHHERFRGSLEVHWHDASISFIKRAQLEPTHNASDPFEVRLAGAISGGAGTGATLRVVIHLTPTAGDCGTAVTGVGITNVGPLTIGGPYAVCRGLSGGVSISPGLGTTAGPQTLHLDSVRTTGCEGTAKRATIIGALESENATCPLAPGQRFRGTLEIDWENHFVSIARTIRLDSTNNPGDPFEARMHGVIKKGADTGAVLDVTVHLTPTQGTCSSGVTAATLTNVGRLTIT